jgi:hypothetical protein
VQSVNVYDDVLQVLGCSNYIAANQKGRVDKLRLTSGR